MSMIASQITRVSIVYSTVCSGADQRKQKLHITGICEGNSPVTSEFPAQRASNEENHLMASSWVSCESCHIRCNSPCHVTIPCPVNTTTGDPLHSRALAHSRAPLFTQPCPHCSHSRAPGEQWARLCVFTLQGCVQAARLCRGSPVTTASHSASHSWSITHSLWPKFDVSDLEIAGKHWKLWYIRIQICQWPCHED